MAQPIPKIAVWMTLLTVSLLLGCWITLSNKGSEQAFAQTAGNKSTPKTTTPKSSGNSSKTSNSPSLDNGPQSLPKATIQSIPVIQQREPIKPRT